MTQAHASPWRRWLAEDLRAYWLLWLIVAGAVALRLYALGRLPGIIGDEAWYGVQAQRLLAGTGGELRTPTGNVPGLFQLGSLSLLHAIFQPSALLLRIPALISSLVAIGLAYAVGRRFFGPAAGMVALVLTACLPASIVYARFGWDPSHASMFVLAAAHAALARRQLLSALLFALGLANHPAALFAAPFLTLAFLGSAAEEQGWRHAFGQCLAFAGMLLFAILLGTILSPAATHYLDVSRSLARIADGGQWLAFSTGFLRLLSGDTVYRFVAGEGFGPWDMAIEWVMAALLIAVVAVGLIAVRRSADRMAAGVVAGWLASLVSLFVVAGPWVFRPGLERFGIPMLAPTAIAVAVLLARCLALDRKRVLQGIVAAIAVPMLAGFCYFYVRPLDRDAGRPPAGLWIGYPNLNQRALEQIEAIAGPDPAVIVAEDWWIEWPVAYLANGSRFQVRAAGEPAPPGRAYWIAYRNGPLDIALSRRSDVRRQAAIESADRKNALQIWSSR